MLILICWGIGIFMYKWLFGLSSWLENIQINQGRRQFLGGRRTPSLWQRWRTTSSSSLPRFLANCLPNLVRVFKPTLCQLPKVSTASIIGEKGFLCIVSFLLTTEKICFKCSSEWKSLFIQSLHSYVFFCKKTWSKQAICSLWRKYVLCSFQWKIYDSGHS